MMQFAQITHYVFCRKGSENWKEEKLFCDY